MATPLPLKKNEPLSPRTVIAAKPVELALVTYTDESNTQFTQLAIIGENNVHLVEGRAMGFSKNSTPQGSASEWLRKAIFEKLGR